MIWLTGARAGETLQSRWADFDLTEGRWKKPRHSTKGDQDHGVPLSEAAVALLRAMYQHRDQTSPFVFPATNNKGERSHRRRIDRARERILKAAGIGDLRTHDLRHDFATIVHDAGAPLAVVGRLLGHRDLAIDGAVCARDRGAYARRCRAGGKRHRRRRRAARLAHKIIHALHDILKTTSARTARRSAIGVLFDVSIAGRREFTQELGQLLRCNSRSAYDGSESLTVARTHAIVSQHQAQRRGAC